MSAASYAYNLAHDRAVQLQYELEEAQSEIRRHHELIAWMRDELEWAACRVSAFDFDAEARTHAALVVTRLHREVS